MRSPRRPAAAGAVWGPRCEDWLISGSWHGDDVVRRTATRPGGSGCASGRTPIASCRHHNGAATARTARRRRLLTRWARLSRFPTPITAAVAELIQGQRKASLAALEADPRDTLARALAAFGRAID